MGKIRDWRNKDDYKDMKGFSLEQWAWEFLRRNSEYIQEWETINRLPQEKKMYEFFKTGAHKWGLRRYVDPNQSYNRTVKFLPLGGDIIEPIEVSPRVITINRSLNRNPRPDQKGNVYIQFNLHAPINPQIERSRKNLKSLQKKFSKGSKTKKVYKPPTDYENWINALRVFDAKRECPVPKLKDIAEIIFPTFSNSHPDYQGNTHVRDAFDAAKECINSKHLEILNYPSKP